MGRALALAGLFALAAAGQGTAAYPPMNEWQEAAMAAQRAAAASVVETINQTEGYSSSSSSSSSSSGMPMTASFRMMGTSTSPATQQNAVQEAMLDSIMHEVQTIFKNTLTVPGWENMDTAADTVKQIVDRVRERLSMSLTESDTGRGMTTAAALRGVTNDFLKEIMVQEAVIETLWAVLRDSQARPWITNEQQAMHVAATQAVHGFLTRMQERLRATGFTEEEINKMLPRTKTCNKEGPPGAPDSCTGARNLYSRSYYSSYAYPSYYSSYGYYPSYYSYASYPRAYSYSYPSYYSYSYPSYSSYSYPSYSSYSYPSYSYSYPSAYSYSYPSYYSYGYSYPSYRSYGYYPSYYSYFRRMGEMMGPEQYPMAPPMGMGMPPPPTPAAAAAAAAAAGVPPPPFPPAPMGMPMGMRRAAAMPPPPTGPMGPMGPPPFTSSSRSSTSRLLEPLNEYESEPERALGKRHRGYSSGCGHGYSSCGHGYGGYGFGYPMIVSYGYHGFGGCGGYGGYGNYGHFGGHGYYPHSFGYGGCGGHFRRLEVPDMPAHSSSSSGSNISSIKTENSMGIAPNTTFRRVGETRSSSSSSSSINSNSSTTGRGSYVSSANTDTHYYPEHSSETAWETYN